MIYLSQIGRALMAEAQGRSDLGVLVTPDSSRRVLPGLPWAADNGCYSRGASFDLGRYLRWLGRPVGELPRCLFAVAPDVVGNATATWERSAPVLPLLRGLGYRAALVAQDGFDAGAVDWSLVDALFVGGTTAWKRAEAGGYAAIREGKRRGLWVHVGRVNGAPFLRNVAAAGADSADGTQLTYRSMWPRTRGWLDGLNAQPTLRLEAAS